MEKELSYQQEMECPRQGNQFLCNVKPKKKNDPPFSFSPVEEIVVGTDFSGGTRIKTDSVMITSANKHANCQVSDDGKQLWCNKIYQWEK